MMMSGTAAIAPAITRSPAHDGAAAALTEELGENERQRRLGEFRGLEVERTEIDPASRSTAHDAEEEHEDQQADDAQIEEVRLVGERSIVEAQHTTIATRPRRCRTSA
jgi:hypothetical protein